MPVKIPAPLVKGEGFRWLDLSWVCAEHHHEEGGGVGDGSNWGSCGHGGLLCATSGHAEAAGSREGLWKPQSHGEFML